MEKIAVLSDIHANFEALKACLEVIDQFEIKHIICLGDIIAKGVHPLECIELLKERNAIFIRGNCDRFFSEEYTQEELTSRITFNQKMVHKEARQFLQQLPFCYECYISGAYVRFVHSTPWQDDLFVGALSPLETKWKMFLPTEKTSHQIADILVYGHTHTPLVDKAFHHTLINAGSVGNSIDVFQDENHPGNYNQTNKACFLVIEGNLHSKEDGPMSYTHLYVPYDIEKELSSPKDNPEKEAYANELRYGKYRDIKKLKILK